MTLRDELVKNLSLIVNDLGGDFVPAVEEPGDMEHGDFTTNAAMILGKKLKRNPMEIADNIVSELKTKNLKQKAFDKAEVVRPGFINFWLSREYLLGQLGYLNKGEILYSKIGSGRVVIVEYSSPNIAKPFTVGHLRSTIIGDAIANLMEAIGYDVKRDNHVGDWGTQFGKQIYAIKTWGNEEKLDKSERPVRMLVELYVKFHDEAEKNKKLEDEARGWFKKLEDGDTEARRLWQRCIDWSWREFEKIYQELGVTFTENGGRGYGESFFEDKMSVVLEELEDKKLIQDSEGAKLIFFPADKYPPLMVVKKDGATLYATRDLATDKFRKEKYGDDILIINEVGIEQSLYFQQLFEVEKLLGWFKEGQRIHIKHGHYRFKDEKMSTRKGNVIWLEDVLEGAQIRAFKIFSQKNVIEVGDEIVRKKDSHIKTDDEEIMLPEIIGIGALKWNDLKREAKQDIVFDWDDILNMEGDSGPYMQYTFARTQSVLRKIQNSKFKTQNLFQNLKIEKEELDLLRLLVRFGEVVRQAGEKFAPNILCNYLFVLAQSFNLFYQKHQILNEKDEIREFRIALTEGTGKVIKKGLDLLGIEALERM